MLTAEGVAPDNIVHPLRVYGITRAGLTVSVEADVRVGEVLREKHGGDGRESAA